MFWRKFRRKRKGTAASTLKKKRLTGNEEDVSNSAPVTKGVVAESTATILTQETMTTTSQMKRPPLEEPLNPPVPPPLITVSGGW